MSFIMQQRNPIKNSSHIISLKILVGLTATPERMDNLDILKYFDGRIAAEIRLSEAIGRNLLAPFHYFGVTDTVDLDDLEWSRGKYNQAALSKTDIPEMPSEQIIFENPSSSM